MNGTNKQPRSVETPAVETVRIVAGQKNKRKRRGVEIVLGAALIALIGVGAAVASVSANQQKDDAVPAPSAAASLRLGYFANVTHAPAIVGLQEGILAKTLGSTKLTTEVFNAGPAAIEALNAGAIDATYIGPNPAINSFVKSKGASIRIVAGATSGGAQLVVKPSITSAEQLRGKVLATPQLGGTQDVALRSWLTEHGLKNNPDGSGDVTINPTDNAQTLKLFQDGKLDGAWVPEPWASRLVLEAGAKVLVNESTLWEKGQFSTTILIVSKKYLEAHPQTVEALVKSNQESIDWLGANKAKAADVVNAGLKEKIGKALPSNVINRSLSELSFGSDPLASTFPKLLEHGVTAGVTKQADLTGIFELEPLNKVLAANGKAAVNAGKLATP